MVLLAVLERVADFLADGRAARFAQHAHAMAKCAQPPCEHFYLRGFAAAFRAFKCDEQAFHCGFGNIEQPNAEHRTSKLK